MKGDFSRDTFAPAKHFSRVLMQQGRVQLDADWNEQAAILIESLRALAGDLIGPHGGPVNNLGFEITPANLPDGTRTLGIGPGRYYVEGILCQAGGPVAREPVLYPEQLHYTPRDKLPEAPYLVYLDVWERHVTCLEDDDIREKALNGPDTATRAQIVWQVKTSDHLELEQEPGDWRGFVAKQWDEWVTHWQAWDNNRLSAWTAKPPADKLVDPCLLPPDARYRGDNRLYRVEIHEWTARGGLVVKWSRDNGSVAAALQGVAGHNLSVQGVRDIEHGFASGQWIEVVHDGLEWSGEQGAMYRLGKVEGETLIAIERLAAGGKPQALAESDVIPWDKAWRHPKVRRWDGFLTPTPGKDCELEYGVLVRLDGTDFRPGDYWLIPARSATGNVEWPLDATGKALPRPPHGVRHHYAPLAIVRSAEPWPDLRCQFEPRAVAVP